MVGLRALMISAPLMLLTLVATGCDNQSPAPSTPTPTPSPTPTPGRTMSARIDGVAWSATAIAAGIQNGVLTISGATPAPSTSVAFTVPATTAGIFTVTPLGLVQAVLTTTAGTWQANGLAGGTGSGSVTLTSVSSTSAAGSFSFVVTPTPGVTGNRIISAGEFNVTF